MTGISTVNSRRLPPSLSSRAMGKLRIADCRFSIERGRGSARLSSICNRKSLVVAGDRFDGGDDLLVGDVIGSADEAGVAPVHEDGPVALGVAPQRGDQLPPFRVVQWTEIHTTFSLPEKRHNRNNPS